MRCVAPPGLDTEFYDKQVQAVMQQLEGEEGLEFTFLFIRGPNDIDGIVDQLDLSDEDSRIMQEKLQEEGSSNFALADEDFLVIDVDSPFLRDNAAAVRGLIGHELMHTVHRDTELEERIQKAALQRSERIIEELADRGYTKDEALRFFRTVVSTAVLCLKDLFANAELIEQGFAADLEEYYYEMLDVDDYCPLPRFYSEEEKLEEVEEAIAFELQLIPSWLPFKGLDREKAEEIEARIEECYEQNIPDAAYEMERIEELYVEEFSKDEAFIDEFFQQVIESALAVIDTKLMED
ncbi:MAG: hypothetical protein SV186_02580 [Candidatus Nanohaloarchaea archaeon]|nr:hypothetical protein [Candidatus Nanohaloarchaea archaeon]